MKNRILHLASLLPLPAIGVCLAAAVLWTGGCSTLPSSAPATVNGNTITIDVAAVLTPILAHNPTYKPIVAALGANLPGLMANGPITPDVYTKALANTPGITPAQSADLAYLGAVLDLALQSYASYSGKTVILYTDPTVKVIVDGFAAALVQASSP